MSPPHARTDLACRNCGAPAPLKFCPECGQETTLHPPTLGEFVHEFVGHYVALEGSLWQTLRLLLTRPGRLTREYLEGRRRRYVLPLRLYLTASFLFFLVLKLVVGNVAPVMSVQVDGRPLTIAEYEAQIGAAAGQAPASAASSPGKARFELMQANACGRPGQRVCSRLETALNASFARAQEHPQEALEHAREQFLHWAPYAIFVLLPAFAGIMRLAYRRRRMTYGEHFVFSMHLHAFWFLAGLVMVLVPGGAPDLMLPAIMAYGVWAMRATYGGGWWPTVLRALFVSTLYFVVLTTALALAGIALLAAN